MKKISLAFLWSVWIWAWFLIGVSQASEVTLLTQGGYSYTSNVSSGNSGIFSMRLEYPVWNELSIGIDGYYHGEQKRGSYGDMIGYGVIGEIIFRPVVPFKTKPYVLGGLGISHWGFNENQDLQDKSADITFDESLSKKLAIGVDYPLDSKWSLNLEASYFQSNLHGHVDVLTEAGIPVANKFSDEEIMFGGGLKYRF